MSIASVQQPPSSRSFALDDFNAHPYTEHAVLSIEEIRLQLYSCFTCGVSWLEDHVCLDCAECDGYSLQRPCPCCDGRCASLWKRDLTMSHACGKARWSGTCQLEAETANPNSQTRDEQTRVCSNVNKMALRP